MKMEFVVETNQADSNGDVLIFSGIKNLGSPLQLQKDFQPTLILDHDCRLHIDGDFIKATANIEHDMYDYSPAIGLEVAVQESTYDEETGITTIHKCKIFSVGLHRSKNANPDIRSIAEQLINGQAKIVE